MGRDDRFRKILEGSVAGRHPHREAEREQVHQEARRDGWHAFRDVDMRGPDPWRHRTWPGI